MLNVICLRRVLLFRVNIQYPVIVLEFEDTNFVAFCFFV